ncbi:hypothetical protein NA56DRAFT_589343 [Hyaloscypha hepaticicola]|uniref:Uncharacterized protein n=1 Tax=Hyaloscypha hepaticicola TaxID=2082293 RepID=A0A2J6QMV1_9HELO|nr:hypothetical protein NA56DRAFT_589343 [Hyaloscypha hepaticicola]
MSYSSPLLSECTPVRPEVVEASTPMSDVLLKDLRIAIELDSRIPTRYGVVTGRTCRTRFRGQSKIVWVAILVIYVGRWVSTAERTHIDGSFPDQVNQPSNKPFINSPPRIALLPLINVSDAAPISLLARADDEDYIVLPNASAHLLPYDTPTGSDDRLSPVDQNNYASSVKPKMLEIVTDLLGSKAANGKRKNSGITHEVLDGVMGWEYLLGEMFGSDHVTTGMDGMCLIQDCIGGVGSPVGLADVFFQSGPAGSEQFAHPWLFQDYVPDVMVMNIGNSDWDSFQAHTQEYNKTLSELSISFEQTYIAMIKAIRTLAYPRYSTTTIDSSRYVYLPQNSGAGIPIFIMRPFRGQLEQATYAVVDRLRKEGDNSLFWLDTSGWLNTEVHFDGRREDQDFFLDEESSTKQWRLTERGNQRVAILLHMHVCRYLAREVDKCAFLPPEIYHGKAIDPEALRFDEYLEAEKERKLKKLFWD